MSSFGRYKPYRRSEHINIIGTRDDDIPDPKGCPRCAIALHYDNSKDVFWCLKCGWNRPSEYDNKQQQQSNHKPKLGIADSITRDVVPDSYDNQSPSVVVSKGTRTEELANRRSDDGFNWLREKDDARLRRQGVTLVSDKITFEDNKTTLSAEDLERERLNRNSRRRDRRHSRL
jgi:hypothetical protein